MTTTKTAMLGRDIFLRATDEKGSVTYSHHRVWDVGLFMAAREREAADLNAKKGSTKAGVAQITHDKYQARA
jgi:hypothetical protein